MNSSQPYIASLTREPFLFHEMRITAGLLSKGLNDTEIVAQIISENLYQYPTERSLGKIARGCLKRLHALGDEGLISGIATQPIEISRQICLYAMMRQSRLIWEFMITVIGAKYEQRDATFSKMDLGVFFMQLQEQNDTVASWSDETIAKLKQIICKTLVECEYLDSTKSDILNPVYLHSTLENAIRANGDEIVLPAFNCFL